MQERTLEINDLPLVVRDRCENIKIGENCILGTARFSIFTSHFTKKK